MVFWLRAEQDASPNPSREQLVDAVQRHFVSQVDKQDSSLSNFYTAALHNHAWLTSWSSLVNPNCHV